MKLTNREEVGTPYKSLHNHKKNNARIQLFHPTKANKRAVAFIIIEKAVIIKRFC